MQTGIGGLEFARKQRGPSAFIVPLSAAILLAAWLLDPDARYLMFAGPFIELSVLSVLTFWAIRSYRRDKVQFEESFQRLLDRYLPSKGTMALARVTALDLGGFLYLAGGWRRPAPAGLSYHRNNATLALVAIVVFGAIPELFVVELFLGSKPLLWHAVDVAAHLYAIFWFVALYVSFRDRPHVFDNGVLVVRRGLLDTIRVPLAIIEAVTPARRLERVERRALTPDTAYLGLFESPMIKLSLSEPCMLERAIGNQRMVTTIYAPVDDQRNAIFEINVRLDEK